MQKAIIVPILFLLAGIVFGANVGRDHHENLSTSLASHNTITIEKSQETSSSTKAKDKQDDNWQSALNISDLLPRMQIPVLW
jgi:hypothetical protein